MILIPGHTMKDGIGSLPSAYTVSKIITDFLFPRLGE